MEISSAETIESTPLLLLGSLPTNSTPQASKIFHQDRGYTRDRILQLFRLIEWMMVLPPDLSSRLNQIEDLTLLKQLLKRAVTVASVDEFEQMLANSETEN